MNLRAQLSLENPMHKAEATVSVAGKPHHAFATGVDMYAAIHLLYDKLDRVLGKHKGKLSDHRRGENPVRDRSGGRDWRAARRRPTRISRGSDDQHHGF